MLTLLTEARFWTARDDIVVKDTDFGAFRYHDKKEISISQDFADGKRNYGEKRNITCALNNKRPLKLRSSIKKLEDYLKHFSIVYCQWRDNAVIQLLLSNGLLVHICINIYTGDILRMAFDKYFIGKLISETVTDAVFTRMHILIAYNQNQMTFVYLQKPSMKRSAPEKISRMDPKIFNVIINGPQNRTISRHLACNNSFDLVAVWTKSSQNEVYPWRPTVRDQDRANVHIYKISRTKLESICYYWTENDPINIEFSRTNQSQLHSVEQKISRKGEVTIEICMYEINRSKLQRISVTSIPLQTQVCCHSFSPDNEKLMLGCIDGSIVLFDEGRGITHLVKAAFIPTIVSWHCDSALVMVANERCQFQCFDISLACIKNQLISEDMTPSNLLDLSGYFMSQPNLLKIAWSKKPDLALHNDTFTQTDCYLLLMFENGPMSCLRFFAGNGLKGDVHTSGFTADVIIHKYLNLNSIEKAINVLLCLNWDTYGAMCLISLHKIANYIFRMPLTAEREVQLQKALGSFHVPVKPLCDETENEFGDQVRDLTRKFFQYLLRFKSYEKAFSLAIDINDEDLFMDLHNCAKSDGNLDLAMDAYSKATEILNRTDSRAESMESVCSRSSCSECENSSVANSEETASKKSTDLNELSIYKPKLPASSSSSASSSAIRPLLSNETTANHPPLPVFNNKKPHHKYWSPSQSKHQAYVPPLPYFSSSTTFTSPTDVRINIPKPELKVSAFSKKQQRNLSAKNRYRPAASNNVLLVDPPLPTIKKTSSQDNLLRYNPDYADFVPAINRTQMYHNSFSTDELNSIGHHQQHHQTNGLKLLGDNRNRRFSEQHGNNSELHLKVGKMPRALPRASQSTLNSSQQHIVIDVVPKPANSSHSSDWQIPDQTLGIPLQQDNNTTNIASYHNYIARPTVKPLNYPISTSATQRKYQSMYNINTVALPMQPVIHQHPITLANIPPPPLSNANATNDNNNLYTTKKLAAASSSSSTNTFKLSKDSGMGTNSILSSIQQTAITPKKDSGEKNKVKFSDTVTVAVVPEIPRKEKPMGDRMKRPTNGFHPMLTDPQRELADSLPLCHPNDEYLKDFTPMPIDDSNLDEDSRTSSSSIKVVHFGIV